MKFANMDFISDQNIIIQDSGVDCNTLLRVTAATPPARKSYISLRTLNNVHNERRGKTSNVRSVGVFPA